MLSLYRWMTQPVQTQPLTPKDTLDQATTKTGLQSRYKTIYQIMDAPKLTFCQRYFQGKGKLSDTEAKEILGRYTFNQSNVGLAAKATYTSLCLVEKIGVDYKSAEGRAKVKAVLSRDVESSHSFIASDIKAVRNEYIAQSIVRWLESRDGEMITDRELTEIADDFDIPQSLIATLLGKSGVYVDRVRKKRDEINQELEPLASAKILRDDWKSNQNRLECAMIELEGSIQQDLMRSDVLVEQHNNLATSEKDTPQLREKLRLLKIEHTQIKKRLEGANGHFEKLKELELEYQDAISKVKYQDALATYIEQTKDRVSELRRDLYQYSNPLVLSTTETFVSGVVQATTYNCPVPDYPRTEEEILATLNEALATNSRLLIINTFEELDEIKDPKTGTSALDKLFLQAGLEYFKSDPKVSDELVIASMRSLLLEPLHTHNGLSNPEVLGALNAIKQLLIKN